MKQLVVMPGKIVGPVVQFTLIDPDNGEILAMSLNSNYKYFLHYLQNLEMPLRKSLDSRYQNYEIVMVEDSNYDFNEMVRKQGEYYYNTYRAN